MCKHEGNDAVTEGDLGTAWAPSPPGKHVVPKRKAEERGPLGGT